MENKLKIIVIFILTVIIIGCARGSFLITGNKYPYYEGIVKIYYSPPPGVKYEEVGVVSAQGGTAHSVPDLLATMQKEAAEYGANAIIVGATQKDQVGGAIYIPRAGFYASSGVAKEITGIAIRIIE